MMSEDLFNVYQKQLELLPVNQHDSTGILHSMVVVVSREGQREGSEVNDSEKATLDSFYTGDGKLISLSESSTPSFLSNLLKNFDLLKLMPQQITPSIVFEEDQFQKRISQLLSTSGIQTSGKNQKVDTSNNQKLVQELLEFEYEARVRLHVSRMLAGDAFPLRALMSEVERGIKESELLTFTSLCASDLYRNNQLQEFEEMILQKTKALPNFTGSLSIVDGEEGSVLRRKYYKATSAFLFAQILANELRSDPLVLKRYYAMTDDVLLCLHWPPPNRRIANTIWQRSIFSENDITQPENFSGGGNTREVVWETTTLTPAGQMIAMVHRLNRDNNCSWLSAILPQYTVGVRSIISSPDYSEVVLSDPLRVETEDENRAIQPIPTFTFTCETSDQIRILAYLGPKLAKITKPDKQGTTILAMQYPNGQQVQLHSSGDIRIITDINQQQLESPILKQRQKLQLYPLFCEVSRFYSENGKVLRRFDLQRQAPFSHEIYYADGQRELYLQTPFYQFMTAQLQPSSFFFHPQMMKTPRTPNLKPSCLEAALLQKIPPETAMIRFCLEDRIDCYNTNNKVIYSCSSKDVMNNATDVFEEVIDAETKAITTYYPDGRLTTKYSNGLTTALFPDGTQFTLNQLTKMLTISRHQGFPEIEMDLDVDSSSRKHAQGMEIPINKGGERVRSRISLPDGSSGLIKYDTRVTAKCNGTIKLVRKDRTCITCKDDGVITFSPSTAWTNEDEEKFMSDCKADDFSPESASKATTSQTPMFPSSQLDHTKPSPQVGSSLLPPPITAAADKAGGSLVSRRKTVGGRSTGVPLARKSPERGRGSSPAFSGAATAHEVFTSNHEPDAVLTVNLTHGLCLIKDYEYNSFEVDLGLKSPLPVDPSVTIPATELPPTGNDNPEKSVENPDLATQSVISERVEDSISALNVRVQLAGEVPGLKPPAVARSPKPPRLFVINRSGDATEILSIQTIRLYEHQVRINPEVSKTSSNAFLPPNELGPATSWRYFTQRKYTGSYFYGYSFQDNFGPRLYQSLKIPASTLRYLFQKPSICSRERGPIEPGRIFDCVSVLERLPLSKEGYIQITTSILKCEEFRQKRLQSIDRFAVEDPRTPEQIKEEEELTKRLKQVYKMAKANAAKKKAKAEEEGDDDASQANSQLKTPLSARSNGSNVSPAAKEYKPGKGNETIKEGENEDEDGDNEDEDDHFGSDDEEEVDPEEAAIRTAFDDFSSPSNIEGFVADVIPLTSLQEAFIRLVNQFISQDLIEKAILDSDEIDMNLEEFTLPEFRVLYRSLLKQMQLSEEQKLLEEGSMSTASPRTLEADNEHPRPRSIGGNDELRSLPSSRAKEYYYGLENSERRRSSSSKTAPPLNLTSILYVASNMNSSAVETKGDNNNDNDNLESYLMNDNSVAVGLPMNAVRRAKTTK